jgi:hypothetical protein
MICDALGTRSISTAKAFLYQLTDLCSQHWLPSEDGVGGKWIPDERELNMILQLLVTQKPRNELQAAQLAQMAAVHLMMMRLSTRALGKGYIQPQDASIAAKLARTFVMQVDALARAKGKKTTRQTIKVSHEKHVHHHQHVHVDRGADGLGGQPHGTGRACEPSEGSSLPCSEQVGEVVRFPGREGEEGLPVPRRHKPGGA